MRWESRRLAAIVFGTLVDLIDTLKSSKSRRSMSSTYSSAAETSASTGSERSSSCRCLGSDPEFTPTRSGTLAARARSTTSRVFSWPPMLPGLMRTQCAPASMAFRASVWLKWMSAITGIGDSRTILLQRLDVLVARDRAAHQVRPRVRDGVNLLHGRVVVGGLGLRHRLDRDRRAAADLHPAHVDLALGSHASKGICRAGPARAPIGTGGRLLSRRGRRSPPRTSRRSACASASWWASAPRRPAPTPPAAPGTS